MNGVRYFVDSNVLLYRYDELSPFRRDRAKLGLAWLLENQCGAVRWQILQEFYWNARAWHWADQTQAPFWDGLIVAAAELTIGSITILDPFRTSPPFS